MTFSFMNTWIMCTFDLAIIKSQDMHLVRCVPCTFLTLESGKYENKDRSRGKIAKLNVYLVSGQD